MFEPCNYSLNTKYRHKLLLSQQDNFTKIRLHLYIPQIYQQEPVISRLIADFALIVNITGAMLGKNTQGEGYFDIEISGTILQINLGLKYLESLNLKVRGKANSSGDSWCY